jgi:hypothetical protein
MPRSSIGGMTRREIGLLITGIGLGLLLSLAVTLEVMLSLRNGSTLSGFSFDKIILIFPVALLIIGLILAVYRKNSDRISDGPTREPSPRG